MTEVFYLPACFLYFVCIGLDIAMFFLQVRLILLWKNIDLLVPFDNAGNSLVTAIASRVPRFLKTRKQLSEKGKLISALAVFAIARIILGIILKSM